jgi:hypothetical protein
MKEGRKKGRKEERKEGRKEGRTGGTVKTSDVMDIGREAIFGHVA